MMQMAGQLFMFVGIWLFMVCRRWNPPRLVDTTTEN